MKVIFALIFMLTSANSANILGIFPFPYFSHNVFHQKIIDILLDEGHNVTVVTEVPFKSHENLTQILMRASQELLEKSNFVKIHHATFTTIRDLELLCYTVKMLWRQMDEPNVLELIKAGRKNHFDLIITEQLIMTPFLAFAELYDCPIVLATSITPTPYFQSVMGNSVNPISDPDPLRIANAAGEMTIFEKIQSLCEAAFFGVFFPAMNTIAHYQIKYYFPSMTTNIASIEDRVVLFLANTNPALGFIKPSTNLIHIGFLIIEPPKPLIANDLKRFLDASERGVIYMSFGTIVKIEDLRADTINIFVNVFKRLKFDVVWRVDSATIHNKPDNVFTTTWVPQADLLAHSKVRLFINHAGTASVKEAIDRAVPMVMFPLFGDQLFYAEQMQRRGIGISLELKSITEKILAEAIEECLKPEYKSNIEHLRELVYDQPMTCREKTVWWLQYILRHKGADHLKYPGRNVPFHQKYCIDIILFLGLALIFATKLMKVVKKYYYTRNNKLKMP